jgi:hypothetical protein
LAEPTLYYETHGNNVTFTLQFTPAPADIAAAVEQHKGIQFKVIRHAATGYLHRSSGGGQRFTYNNIKLQRKNTERGWNYRNWIQNYFPASYKNQLSSYASDLGYHVLTIPTLEHPITNITAAELQSGTIVRTLPIFRSMWPQVEGATGGGGSNGQYEFFVGLLY